MIDKKKVNIFPRRPINTDPPIRIPVKNVAKSISDIRKAIICGAKVEEVLPNGKTILLNLNNYDLDNSAKVDKDDRKPREINVDFNKAEPARPGLLFSSPANIPTNPAPVDIPKKEETVELMDDSINTIEESTIETEEHQEELQKLSRKQRRALERKQHQQELESVNTEESIETKDPE